MLHIAPFVLAAAAASAFQTATPRLVLYEPGPAAFQRRAREAVAPALLQIPVVEVIGPAGMPACAGETCAPRVAVPGHEPAYSIRGKRTELAFIYLNRFHIEPVATIAGWLATSGVRLDFTPPSFEPGQTPVSHPGWGRFTVYVRWRLDANNAPVFFRG